MAHRRNPHRNHLALAAPGESDTAQRRRRQLTNAALMLILLSFPMAAWWRSAESTARELRVAKH